MHFTSIETAILKRKTIEKNSVGKDVERLELRTLLVVI